jgi:hypothetical protein
VVREQLANQLELKMVENLFPPYFFSFEAYNLVMAAMSLSNIVKSSLGPLGLDKMLVDDIGVCDMNN